MDNHMIRRILQRDAASLDVTSLTWERVKYRAREREAYTEISPNRVTKHRSVYIGAAAVAMCGLLLSAGFVSPAMASVLKAVPLLGQMYSFQNPKLNQYATKPGAEDTVTDKGIAVSVPKVYFDGANLEVLYSIQVPKGYQPSVAGSQIQVLDKLRINGKPVQVQGIEDDSLASPNLYLGYIHVSLASNNLPHGAKLKLPIDQVGEVAGNWTISVPISGQSVIAATRSIPLHKNAATYDGMTLSVTSVAKGPVYTTVHLEMRQPLKPNGQPRVPFTNFDFNVFTEDHHFLPTQGLPEWKSYNQGNQAIWDVPLEFDTQSSHVKSIVVMPQQLEPVTGPSAIKIAVTNQFPIKLKLDGYGTTDINSVQFNPNMTIVTTTLEPDGVEHPSFWLEDQNGHAYTSLNPTDGNNLFPVIQPGAQLYICAKRSSDLLGQSVDVPQLEITVPLK